MLNPYEQLLMCLLYVKLDRTVSCVCVYTLVYICARDFSPIVVSATLFTVPLQTQMSNFIEDRKMLNES